MGIYVNFIKTTHVTLASNFKKFYFLLNSVLNFGKSYQIWGNWPKNKKVTSKQQIGEWNPSPPPA